MQGICAATGVPKLSIVASVHGLSSSLCKSNATTLSGSLLRSSQSPFLSFRRPHCFGEFFGPANPRFSELSTFECCSCFL